MTFMSFLKPHRVRLLTKERHSALLLGNVQANNDSLTQSENSVIDLKY